MVGRWQPPHIVLEVYFLHDNTLPVETAFEANLSGQTLIVVGGGANDW